MMVVDPPFTLIPRDALWPGEIPRTSGGALRPMVFSPAAYFTAHDTGSPGDWADFYDSTAEARAIHVYSQHADKPWEYNWIVDTEGNVVEYAGMYQAAHSAGENSEAHGVLLLLGIGQRPTPAMELAYRQLRWWLVQNNKLNVYHRHLPHQQMPGAATACPSTIMPYWQAFDRTWSPPTPQEDEMIAIYRRADFRDFPNDPWLCADGGSVRPAAAYDTKWAEGHGVPVVDVPNLNEYWNMVEAAGLTPRRG